MDNWLAVAKEWSLAVVGAVLLSLSVLHLLVDSDLMLLTFIKVGLPIVVSLGILLFSVHVQEVWEDPTETWHVTRWTLGGVVSGLFIHGWFRLLLSLEGTVMPGASYPIALNSVGIGVGFGSIIGYYYIRLRVRTHKLRERTIQLDEFASIVSHDLRNPLNLAQGHLQLVRDRYEDDSLEKIADAHQRMERLIEEVLALSRQGEALGDIQSVRIDNIAKQAWSTVPTEGATLTVETADSLEADPQRLRALFENLFRNAVDHAGADVTVRVGLLSNDAGFYVEDDGPGIPPDERERVFEGGYSTQPSGTGFGLAIVRRIAEAHEWSVEVDEGELGGARFVFRTE